MIKGKPINKKIATVIIVVLGILLAAILIAKLYIRYAYLLGVYSDSTSTLQYVNDIFNGNIILKGWVGGYAP